MTTNYVVLTDKSTAITNLMNSFTPKPTMVKSFTAHNLWQWIHPNDADVAIVQVRTEVYATVLLPDPL